MSETSSDTMTVDAAPATEFRLLDLINELSQGNDVYFTYVKTVGDLMNSTVNKLTMDDCVQDAVDLLADSDSRHIMLVDRDEDTGEESFIGIISDRDVTRQLSQGYGTAAQADSDEQVLKSSLSSIVTRNPPSASPESPLAAALEQMIDEHVDCLTVMNDANDIVGTLTPEDLARVFIHVNLLQRMSGRTERRKARLIDVRGGRSTPDAKMLIETHFKQVKDVMSMKPHTISPEGKVGEAITLMIKNDFRHLPVVDGGELVGIISDRDILRALPPKGEKSPGGGDSKGGWLDELFAVAEGAEELDTEVRLVMTGKNKLVTATPDTILVSAITRMMESKVNSILVVDEGNDSKVGGILTTTDLLRGVNVLNQMVGG